MQAQVSYYTNHHGCARFVVRVGKGDSLRKYDLRQALGPAEKKTATYIHSELSRLFGSKGVAKKAGVQTYKAKALACTQLQDRLQQILEKAVGAQPSGKKTHYMGKPNKQKTDKRSDYKALAGRVHKLSKLPNTGLSTKEIMDLLTAVEQQKVLAPTHKKALRISKNPALPRTLIRTIDGRWLAQLKGRNGAKVLGSGGFKRVKTALDLETGEILASATVRGTAKEVAKIQEEVKLGQKYQNAPGLHGVLSSISYRSAKHPGQYKACVFSKLANKGDLRHNLRHLTNAERKQVAEDFLKGLTFLHKDKVHHRDIKPENVLLHQDSKGRLRAGIADFGGAYVEGDEKGRLERFCYTPGYAAPEVTQLRTYPANRQADIYAAGIVLAELFPQKAKTEPAFTRLLVDCLQEYPSQRPNAKQLQNRFQQIIV